MNKIMTLDVGTGSGRCIIFDLEGQQLASAQREWIPRSLPQYPGSQEFDTTEAWTLLCQCIREAMDRAGIAPSEIAGVTATSMREGMVLYDEAREVIWACPNVDARAVGEAAEMIAAGLAEPIYRVGGDWLNIISPPRFWWIRRHMPEVYERIAHMNMLSDWVLFELSGEIVTDPSIGSSSGLFDLAQRTWSEEIIEVADLPPGIYPQVYESGTAIGEVTTKAARDTGLAPGTPVITSGADTQLALVGVGAARPGSCVVVGGGFWQTAMVADKPVIDPEYRLRTLCHAVPGQWMTEGIGFYHGFAMRWFRDGFCQEEKSRASQEGIDAYHAMEKLAETVPPGSNGVQAIFSDVMNSKRWKHAPPSLMGFDILAPERSGKKECIRAIEENAAYVSLGHLHILQELTGSHPDEIVFCGGSSKGFLWPQIVADVLGRRLRIPEVRESTSLGAAICVGVALGFYSGIDDAAHRLVRWEKVISPDMEHHVAYQEHYRRWREVYARVLPIGDQGLLPSLWRAPGV